MSIRSFTLAAATAFVATASAAQLASAGDAQLALKVGVEPGAYSTSQLIRLLEAQRDNDTNRVNFILNQRDETATRSYSVPFGSAPSESTSTFGTGVNSDKY